MFWYGYIRRGDWDSFAGAIAKGHDSAKALKEIDIPIAESLAVNTVDEALEAAEIVGYPIIVRSAYALGGLGSGFANNPEELRNLSARSLSLSPQILVEKSLKGWKEAEYEVVRDRANSTSDSHLRSTLTTDSDRLYHCLQYVCLQSRINMLIFRR